MDNNTHLANEFIAEAMLPSTIIYTISLSLGFLGNIGVLFIYIKKMPKQRFEQRYFIPVLALFDMLVCAVSLIYYIVQTYRWITFYSDIVCKLMVCLVVFTMMTSDAFLLAIAIQRYIKIRRPYGKQMDLTWRRLSIVFIILAGLVYSFPSLVVAGVSDFVLEYKGVNISGQSCYNGSKRYPTIQAVYHGVLTFISMTYIILTSAMYTPIAVVIFRRQKRRHSARSLSRRENSTDMASSEGNMQQSTIVAVSNHSDAPRVNFNMMFLIIISVFVLSYFPTATVNFITFLSKDYYRHVTTTEYAVTDIFVKFYTFNHIANPFIYTYFDTEFRNCLKRMLKCHKI